MRSANLALAMTMFAFALPGQKDADARVAPSRSAPTGKRLEWTSVEGKTYFYRLPKKINAKRPPNLILMLHGTGLTHHWSFLNYPIA